MITIKEKNYYKDCAYLKQEYYKDTKISEKIVRCKADTIMFNDKKYYLLYNGDYTLNEDVFRYLNEDCEFAPETKAKILTSLKYLYSFSELFDVDIRKMTETDVKKLIQFLLGRTVENETYKLSSEIQSKTANDYLIQIRMYIEYLGCDNHPLTETKTVRKMVFDRLAGTKMVNVKSFTHKIAYNDKVELPDYIEIEEYKKVRQYFIDKNNQIMVMIIDLMYMEGMRVGEVLGLTYEDVKQGYDENGNLAYKLITRNRLSDKDGQSAKYMLHPLTKADYDSEYAKQRGVGYDEVNISRTTYNELLNFIEETVTYHQNQNGKRWYKASIADVINEQEFKEKYNFYLFLNTVGRPMSRKTVNNLLHEAHKAVGIEKIETNYKSKHVAHLYRHGFAMYQLDVMKTPIHDLMKLMRHKNLSSTLIYLTPKTSDLAKYKEDMAKELEEKYGRSNIY